MEQVSDKREGLVSHIKEYIEVKAEEVKLDAVDKSSRVMASVISGLLILLMIAFTLLFASMAVAYILGEAWGRIWLGFVVVCGFYVIVVLVVWVGKERIMQIPIANNILKQLTQKNDDD